MTNIPEGYKQTEIGIIPNNREVKTFGDAFSYLPTASFTRDDLGNDTNGVGCVHYGDIHTKFGIYLDLNKFNLPSVTSDKWKKYPTICDGDIIMADASEDYEGIGKAIEVKNLGDKKAVSGLHTILLREKGDDFVNGYKGFICKNWSVKKEIERLATGLKVYGISKNVLKNIQISIPSKPEQKLIATVLSDMDELISNLEDLIQKKKNIKIGTMQKLLSPKEGWIKTVLGELIDDISDGGTPSTDVNEYFGGDINWVVIEDIRDEIYTTKDTLTEDGLKHCSSKLRPPETIILSTGATIGEVGIAKVFTATKQGICGIVVKGNISNLYLKYRLQTNKSKLISMAQGSSIKEVRAPILVKIPIIIPPTLEEQQEIAIILSDMDNEIKALEEKKTKYEQIKQGAMQQLLTGKIRLV